MAALVDADPEVAAARRSNAYSRSLEVMRLSMRDDDADENDSGKRVWGMIPYFSVFQESP